MNSATWSGSYSLRPYPGPRRAGHVWRTGRPSTGWSARSGPGSPGVTCRNTTVPGRPSTPASVSGPAEKRINRPDEPDDHALGRSRGGLTTKIHLACDGKGRPLAVLVTPGQRHDSICARPPLERIRVPRTGAGCPRCRPDQVIADKAHSSRRFRADLRKRGNGHTINHLSGRASHHRHLPLVRPVIR